MQQILSLAPPRKVAVQLNSDTGRPITVRLSGGGTATFRGREAWTLRVLIRHGSSGVTTAQLPPGVRFSHYILKLRRAGVRIDMVRESHSTPFEGTHGRYRLAAPVVVLAGDLVAA